MTESQRASLERNWAKYGIEFSPEPMDLPAQFGRSADTVFEIGFGMGDSFVDMAKAAPEKNFLGVEVHLPGVGRMLNRTESEALDNIRCLKEDAVEVLEKMIPEASLATVQLFFPDPWHKKKHHKRRIVQPDFAQLVRRKLAIGGTFHLATDWQNYAEHMLEVMDDAQGFENSSGNGNYCQEKPAHRPNTKFEKRGERLGHGVWDLIYTRRS